MKSARQIDAEYAPAQWHQGCVQYQKQWIDAEQLPALLKENPRIALYIEQRAQVRDTINGNLELADWCQKKGLAEQERAHLMRVLDFDSNHRLARTKLGFRQINGQWVTPAQLQQAQKQFASDRKNFATWGPRIEKLRKQFRNGSPTQRAAARQQILAINDCGAIVALEQVLARDSEPVALLALETLHRLSDYEATRALARIAVTTPSAAGQEQASQ